MQLPTADAESRRRDASRKLSAVVLSASNRLGREILAGRETFWLRDRSVSNQAQRRLGPIATTFGKQLRNIRRAAAPVVNKCRTRKLFALAGSSFTSKGGNHERTVQGSLETDRRVVASGSDSPLSIRLSVSLRANDYNSANPAGFSKYKESSGSMNVDEE